MTKRRVHFEHECGTPELSPTPNWPDAVPFSGQFGVLVDRQDLIDREDRAAQELFAARTAIWEQMDRRWWNHLLPIPPGHPHGYGMTRTVLMHPRLDIPDLGDELQVGISTRPDFTLRRTADPVDQQLRLNIVNALVQRIRDG